MALTDDAIAKIKAMIIAGELKPGDRLPIEKDLATRLGLSRNSLREAIRALSVLRVLETRQGAGTYVTSLAPGPVLNAVSFIVDFHDNPTSLHFLDVRRLLESEAAARASQRTGEADVRLLHSINGEIRAIAKADHIDSERLLEADRRFHALIAQRAGNPVLAALADMMGGQTTPARISRVTAIHETAARAADEHELIIVALAAGDSNRARIRAASHVLGLEDWLEQELAGRI